MFDRKSTESEASASLSPCLYPATVFDALPFPVFAADKNGRLLYRNRAAAHQIGPMRRGGQVGHYLLGPPLENGLVLFSKPKAYARALMLSVGTDRLYLAFSRLQFSDAEVIAHHLQENAVGEEEHLLQILKKAAAPSRRVRGTRIYTELFRLFPTIPRKETNRYSLSELTDHILPHLEGAFSALGYCITTKTAESFRRFYPICMERCDLLHLLELLIYTVMKCSVNGKVTIFLDSDSIDSCHQLTLSAEIPCAPTAPTQILPFLEEAAPELAAEMWLLGLSSLIERHIAVFCRENGLLQLRLSVPYLTSSFDLQSPGLMAHDSQMLEGFTARLFDLLKENASFCRDFPSGD